MFSFNNLQYNVNIHNQTFIDNSWTGHGAGAYLARLLNNIYKLKFEIKIKIYKMKNVLVSVT